MCKYGYIRVCIFIYTVIGSRKYLNKQVNKILAVIKGISRNIFEQSLKSASYWSFDLSLKSIDPSLKSVDHSLKSIVLLLISLSLLENSWSLIEISFSLIETCCSHSNQLISYWNRLISHWNFLISHWNLLISHWNQLISILMYLLCSLLFFVFFVGTTKTILWSIFIIFNSNVFCPRKHIHKYTQYRHTRNSHIFFGIMVNGVVSWIGFTEII